MIAAPPLSVAVLSSDPYDERDDALPGSPPMPAPALFVAIDADELSVMPDTTGGGPVPVLVPGTGNETVAPACAAVSVTLADCPAAVVVEATAPHARPGTMPLAKAPAPGDASVTPGAVPVAVAAADGTLIVTG